MAFVAHFDAAGNPDFSCSGTLIADNVVLTAGHCAVDESNGAVLDPSGFAVVTGAVDWTDAAHRQVSSVSRVAVYPAFDPVGPRHDAALLVLSAPVSNTTIPLWGSGGLSAGTPALIAGWGDIDSAQTPTTLLQWAPTAVQSVAYCRQRFFSNYPYDPYSDLCAINPPSYDTATCQGDSGGPLLADDASGNLIEIGLTSVGPSDCNTGYPDYFTAIEPVESWIANQVSSVAIAAPIGMTFADAHSYVRQVLAHLFGSRFRYEHSLQLSCGRISSVRIRCGFSFWSGPNDYYGNVTVYYYTANDGTTYWNSRYRTYFVNDRCYFHTNHPSSCRTHRHQGSW